MNIWSFFRVIHANSSCCVPLSQKDVEEEKERPSVKCYDGENNKVILKMCVEYTIYVDDHLGLPCIQSSIYYELL